MLLPSFAVRAKSDHSVSRVDQNLLWLLALDLLSAAQNPVFSTPIRPNLKSSLSTGKRPWRFLKSDLTSDRLVARVHLSMHRVHTGTGRFPEKHTNI
jgi:hypothetical protein